MDLGNAPESGNIEDRRGQSGGGGMSLGGGTGGLGIGAIVIVLIISYFTGINPAVLLGGAEVVSKATGVGSSSAPMQSSQAPAGAPVAQNDPTGRFLAKVLGSTEGVWAQVLPAQKGVAYSNVKLVLFNGATSSACGTAQSAMGPFYCPNDKKVYLDTSFFNDMQSKYGGGGDFAYAYVVAHEIGHHVQDLLGTLDQVDAAKQNASRTQANALSVRVELQADCFAGVWAYNANEQYRLLQPGDIEKAMATASAIGDDKLQTAARGYAVPDSFTHGTSALRQQWLTAGLKSGQVDSCNTFAQ
jgi:predicted metalloprotease